MDTSASNQKKQNQIWKSKLSKYMTAPFRGLTWMRDFYMRKIMSCADKAHYGDVAYPGVGVAMSRSQSVRSTADDDLQELIRAVSQKDHRHLNLDSKLVMAANTSTTTTAAIERVPRSQSVAVGRIDEDKPMEFDGDVKLGPLYPRSRSAAPMREPRMV